MAKLPSTPDGNQGDLSDFFDISGVEGVIVPPGFPHSGGGEALCSFELLEPLFGACDGD
jgi:hypothetical protein